MDGNHTEPMEPIRSRILGIRDGAEAVLRRLDSGEKLSAVLPQAKAVTDDRGDSRAHSFWLQFEIYGLADVPLAKPPFSDPDQEAGARLFCELHSLEDTVQRALSGRTSGEGESWANRRDKVDVNSVAELERSADHWRENRDEFMLMASAPTSDRTGRIREVGDWALQARERERIVRDVRSYLYDHMSRIRRWAVVEVENVALLGPDYRIVLESLDALRTDVRGEFAVALENLNSSNPANWSACALVCRNVVMALGRTLWTARASSYESMLAGKDLTLKGEKEVNRLSAFIDHHWRSANKQAKQRLAELDVLARSVYERGSKGKQQGKVRHEEAQKLVVDTFELVAELDRLVGLSPITDR